ncbi:MAG: hypothetical protein QW153_03880 [Candidatus Bilamarchaeaceae archaeon]
MEYEVKRILKNTFFYELNDETKKRLEELAKDLGYEKTITPKTRLSFLLKVYQTKKAKKNAARRLKEAEKMIMQIASLRYNELKGKEEKEKKEDKKNFQSTAIFSDISFLVNERMKKIFERLGIKDKKSIEEAIWSLGEKEVENRAEIVFSSKLDEKTIQGIFDFNPKLIMESFEKFVATIEMLETKKEIIDAWKKSHEEKPPLDYAIEPAILFTDYAVLQKILSEAPKEKDQKVTEKEEVEYRAKPMRAEDLIKILTKGFGCEVREGNHYIVLNPSNGKTTTISKSHKGQMELNKSVIKKIVQQQLGIDLNTFQKKREEMGL